MSTVLAVGGLVANVAGTLYGGYQKMKAAEEEAADLEFQAEIQQREADEEAARLDKKNKKFLAHQSLMYVKSGVTLSGSPLAVLKETRVEAAKESEAIRQRGIAQYQLGLKKAGRTASAGRGAFIGSLFSGFSTGGTGAYEIFKS